MMTSILIFVLIVLAVLELSDPRATSRRSPQRPAPVKARLWTRSGGTQPLREEL